MLPRLLRTYALAICFAHAGHAAAQTSDEFFDIVNLALPPELSDAATNADSLRRWLNPSIAQPQLSKAFDPRKAYLAVDPRSRLSPDPSCFREKEAGNDPNALNERCEYSQGETTGELPAVQLRFNLFRGKFTYLSRGRGFDFTRSPENKVPVDAARATAQQLAVAFGIPQSELDLTFADVRQLTAAAVAVTSPTAATAAVVQQTIKVAEVQVRIPRKVGELPVFDSQFFAAMGDDGSGKPVVARVHGQWPDFVLLPGLDANAAFDRETLARLIADRLRAHTLPGTLQPLVRDPLTQRQIGTRGYLAYVPVAQMDICFDTSDEKGSPPGQGNPGGLETRPQDRARLYVPGVVLFAVPRVPNRQTTPLPSTGVEQLSVPLLDVSKQFCDGSV